MTKTKKERLAITHDMLSFRCKHRHNAISHPKCYLRYLRGDQSVIKDNRLPKVLVFDIETSPLEAYVFQTQVWNARISDEAVISDWYMLTWSAKWLHDDEVMSARLTGKEALKEDDGRIVKQLWDLFDEAEIIIAHNGGKFDVPNMNTRFLVNHLPPPSPYQTIDTLLVARKQFGFTHNSLNALAKAFGLDPKLETDFQLWKQAKGGSDEALSYMEEYNQGDVTLLENVYLVMRPWIKSHPNLGLYMLSDGAVCPNCGSKEIHWLTDKYYYTQTSRFPIYRCNCGAYGRSRKSDLDKEIKKALTVGIAR